MTPTTTLTHNRYRNLADWSPAEWENLDIYTFIAANFNRYCASLIKKVGLQYLPSDATDCLLGLFCDVSHKPMSAVHQKNLSAEGERRNQIMLGTLKMIAATRMVDALIKEYPSYINLDQLPEFSAEEDVVNESWFESNNVFTHSYGESMFFAASSDEHLHEELDQEQEAERNRLSTMVELLRDFLTPVQYKHIRFAVCDGLDAHEIAAQTGHSVTNVRIMLLNARKKMLELVPQELYSNVESCVHRR